MGGERCTKPIIIVTGANGGVGYAICQRLLLQLCQRIPHDALPQKTVTSHIDLDEDAEVYLGPGGMGDVVRSAGAEGVTIIMACRNVTKAEEARNELLKGMDGEVHRLLKEMNRTEKGEKEKEQQRIVRLRENVVVEVEKLDLASLESVKNFSAAIQRKYPYVSHLVCNAGLANFTGYDWPLAVKQLCTHFVTAVTRPLFKLQLKGQKSGDGLGLIVQSNVLSHYFIFRLLGPLFTSYAARSSSSSRILWMSSLEADPACYDPEDWQLLNTEKPYDASKFQMDLLAGHFEKEQERTARRGDAHSVRHLIVHPGIVRTNIAISSLNSVVLDYLMQVAFFLAHCCGSTAHVWTPYKAAVSAVHLILVALPFVTAVSKNAPIRPHIANKLLSRNNRDKGDQGKDSNGNNECAPIKFGAEADFWFREYVGVTEVQEWEKMKVHGADLVEKFDKMYDELIVGSGRL